MLGQPALFLAHSRGDAQRKALLAQQGVAVARAIGPDFTRFGVVNDVLGLAAGPGGLVLLAVLQRCADGMHAGHEFAVGADHVVHGATHAGHQLHVDGHIGAVGQLDTHMGDGRAQGPMEKGTTYMVRPVIQPSNRGCKVERISAGAIQLLVGPASSFWRSRYRCGPRHGPRPKDRSRPGSCRGAWPEA